MTMKHRKPRSIFTKPGIKQKKLVKTTETYVVTDANGNKTFFKGRTRDRNIEDWEDRKQNEYLKYLESIRKSENQK